MALFQFPATPGFLASQGICTLLTSVVIEAATKFTTMEDALGSYGVYHRNPINQILHILGVPGVNWSLMMFMSHIPLPVLGSFTLSLPFTKPHPITWATLLALFDISFYIKIDPSGGLLFMPFVYAMYASSVNFRQNDQAEAKKSSSNGKAVSWTGTGKVLRFAAIVQALGWYVQIHPGHGVFEGAKPPLIDTIRGTLTTNQFFAFYEALWKMGFNKELQQKALAKVAENIVQICATGVSKPFCDNL